MLIFFFQFLTPRGLAVPRRNTLAKKKKEKKKVLGILTKKEITQKGSSLTRSCRTWWSALGPQSPWSLRCYWCKSMTKNNKGECVRVEESMSHISWLGSSSKVKELCSCILTRNQQSSAWNRGYCPCRASSRASSLPLRKQEYGKEMDELRHSKIDGRI